MEWEKMEWPEIWAKLERQASPFERELAILVKGESLKGKRKPHPSDARVGYYRKLLELLVKPEQSEEDANEIRGLCHWLSVMVTPEGIQDMGYRGSQSSDHH